MKIDNQQGESYVPLIDEILLSGKLGDGCIHKNNRNIEKYCITFVSVHKDYTDLKLNILKKDYKTSKIRIQKSGYKVGNTSYTFSTYSSSDITKVKNYSIIESIKLLNRNSLILYYLDDGSLHKRKKFIHLYCNMFSIEECEFLINKIYEIYPIKKTTLRWDVKKDGRKFPYLYVPVSTAKEFLKDIKEFVEVNNLSSFLYKADIVLPSTTNSTKTSQ